MEKTDTGRSHLWEFMLRFYARPGVAPACLRLQEACGIDIPLFLALLHAAASGRVLNASWIELVDRTCVTWRESVVKPLRAIRTDMKSSRWMTLDRRVPELREEIKSMELFAERIEVEILESLIIDLPIAASSSGSQDTRKVALFILARLSNAGQGVGNDDAMLLADAAAEFLSHGKAQDR